MDDAAPLIELKDLSFKYPSGRSVLKGVDLALCRGDRIGLTGSNGSGKTTLLHLMVGLLRPDSGSVFALGVERREEKEFFEVRSHIGLVFQDPEDQLFCPTVAEDVAFGPFNLGWSRDEVQQAVAETLRQLGLAHLEQRLTHRLSFGEKRLVSLATVLAMRPVALLLDEPSASLDADVTERLIAVLQTLDVALLVVSHDERFLDRVVTSRVSLCEGKLAKLSASEKA